MTFSVGQRSKFLQLDLFAAAGVIIVAALATLVGALFYEANRADEAAQVQAEAIVANGLNVRVSEIAAAAAAEIQEDAIHPGSTAGALALGLDFDFDIDANNRVVLAQSHGLSIPSSRFDAFSPIASPLIASLRQMAVSQNALPSAGARAALQSSAIASVEGQIYVVTATVAEVGRHAPLITLTAERIDDEFLDVLTDRFLLDNLELKLGDASSDGGRAHVVLNDGSGAAIATLEWWPGKPGAELLRTSLLPVFVLIVVLGIAGGLLYRRGQRSARNLLASEARATHLAYHDALTGLPNRLLLADRLGRAIEDLRRRNTPFAVHCIDLDRFKDVNDTFGHAAGDELIRLAAQKIGSACRSADTVARLGGDEFAVIQIGASLDGVATLAERIVSIMNDPMDLSVGRVHIGASIGVSIFTEAVSDPQECLRQADLALYRVKENGRGNYCMFEPEMDATVRFRRSLQTDLHEALEREQLTLAYQPQVDGGGKIVGLEGLVRWTHPERGPIAPSVFVPIAEECGLIDALGMFTLRRAFEDSRRWPDLRIAINLSATQLRLKDFVTRLAALVTATDIDPKRFELEITEGVLLGDDPQTHAALHKIRELGFSLALDDFGTGYSSLSYLQRYPIDKIKIDRSFVTNLGVDREADAVVGAIIRLARALNLDVIAEGVENNEQRLHLARAGCSEVQGFLFGRPSTAEAIDELMRERDHQPALAAAH